MNNFIKTNYKDNDTFVKEANDLKLLSKYIDTNYLKTPQIFHVSNETLEMQRIFPKKATNEMMQRLGVGLAKLHQHQFTQYGFEEDNFIGLSEQKNSLSNNWGEFFFHNRLLYQVNKLKPLSLQNSFQELLSLHQDKIIGLLNKSCQHPSLVHGDLWSGNVMFDESHVWLIDPSSYYADREVDIAMTELFSGFSQSFYEAYNATYPLSDEYEQKKVIYNLYHLLNHYNLFGHTYLEECKEALVFIQKL